MLHVLAIPSQRLCCSRCVYAHPMLYVLAIPSQRLCCSRCVYAHPMLYVLAIPSQRLCCSRCVYAHPMLYYLAIPSQRLCCSRCVLVHPMLHVLAIPSQRLSTFLYVFVFERTKYVCIFSHVKLDYDDNDVCARQPHIGLWTCRLRCMCVFNCVRCVHCGCQLMWQLFAIFASAQPFYLLIIFRDGYRIKPVYTHYTFICMSVYETPIYLGLATTIYIYGVHTVFWQGNHQIHDHIRCISTVYGSGQPYIYWYTPLPDHFTHQGQQAYRQIFSDASAHSLLPTTQQARATRLELGSRPSDGAVHHTL